VMIRLADHHWLAGGLTLAAALVSWRTRFNPLWLLAAGAALGAAGYV